MISFDTLMTERLLIKPLATIDSEFMLELVNSPGWLEFIGDKKVYSKVDASHYIKKINDDDRLNWVVKLKGAGYSVGLITFIKRPYLEHHDIGFAFLPDCFGKGYAYEATYGVLCQLAMYDALKVILATTLAENKRSIKLLKRLGLEFDREIQVEQLTLHLYKAPMRNYRLY